MNNEIKVGDRVRSFDFADGKWGFDLEGDRAAYAEGVVVAIAPYDGPNGNFDAYEIICYKDFFGGRERSGIWSRIGLRIFAPVNGTPKTFGDVCNGVVLVDEDEYNEARNAACDEDRAKRNAA